MKKILVTTSSYGEEDRTPLKLIEEAGYQVVLNPYRRRLGEQEALRLLLEHRPVGLVAGLEPLSAGVLGEVNFLKAISRCGVGMDNVDLEAAGKANIKVANTPSAPARAVAELGLALVLALYRNVVTSTNDIKAGRWERPMGGLLYGKTAGIVGCGRIGSIVAELLAAFRVRLLGFDPALERHPLIEMVPLEALLEQADIVTLHLPQAKGSAPVAGRAFLEKMKRGAVLINTARGGLVDERALFELLQAGHLGGAGLDVFAEEPYRGDFTTLPGVVLTPHVGSYAREARIEMEREAAENLLALLAGCNCEGGGLR